MWARLCEAALGAWLLVAPHVLPGGGTAPWLVDHVAGAAVIALALLSFRYRTRRAHLGSIAIGLLLAGYGWVWGGPDTPPAAQNEVITGLLVLLFAVVPSNASRPPAGARVPR